jgi:hypothetical protein
MSSSSATSWPEAVIKLKQGFGRQFLDSLPDCTLVIDDGDAD